MEISIHQLCPSEGKWRVDWLGNLEYQGYGMYKQPCISVSVTQIGSALFSHREAWVPLGSMPLVKAGDVWEDGKLFSSPEGFETFPDLAVGPDTVKMVKAGVEFDGAFLLPFEGHPEHRQHTHSYCVLAKVDDAHQLVIPCMEMIRFYFGSSSNFLTKLFTQPFSEKSFWADIHFDADIRHLHLKLPHWISAASATDIGRIAQSQYARTCVGRIYESCVKASSTNQPVYPYMGFPFTGKTTLVANGVWLPSDGSTNTFVVRQLLNCSHPFPFASLTYETGRPAKSSKVDQQTSKQGKPKPVVKSKTSQESKLVKEDPGRSKSPKKVEYHQSVRFPDLLKKSVWHREIVVQSSPEVLVQHENGDLEKVAFGAPEGSGEARAIEAIPGPQRLDANKATDLPHFVKRAIAQIWKDLRLSKSLHKANLIRLPEYTEYVFTLPVLVDEDGVINEATQFTEPDGSHRQRQGCFIEVRDAIFVLKTLAVIEGRNIKDQPSVLPVMKLTIEQLVNKLCA